MPYNTILEDLIEDILPEGNLEKKKMFGVSAIWSAAICAFGSGGIILQRTRKESDHETHNYYYCSPSDRHIHSAVAETYLSG
jgi:hypothetical protein